MPLISVFFFAYFLCFAADSHASTTYIELPTIQVLGKASFEELNQQSLLPAQSFKFTAGRSRTEDLLNRREVFQVRDFGFPSAPNGINLGGRSIDDTQVSTLGIPLNLPQGGGPDLSFFPSYLWSGATLRSSVSATGFSPQAASGSVQLELWTRDQLNSRQKTSSVAGFTVDRNLQTLYLGTRTQQIAMIAGASEGLRHGPAGSLSYQFFQSSRSQMQFHVIGSEQKGVSPPSIAFPGPDSQKSTWRILPVLEGQFALSESTQLATTLYADHHQIRFETPGSITTDTQTEQYGIENALTVEDFTFALSARYTRFRQTRFSDPGKDTVVEWPILGSMTRKHSWTKNWTVLTSVGALYLENPGLAATGKLGAEYQANSKEVFFSELATQPKMPSLTARYYRIPSFYTGNPNLKPERVNSLQLGYRNTQAALTATTTLKLEHRSDVQLDLNQTTLNSGAAHLVYLQQDFKTQLFDALQLEATTLLSTSRLHRSQLPYPDLPFLSQTLGLEFWVSDDLQFSTHEKYLGPSTASSGAFHAPYFLTELKMNYFWSDVWSSSIGIEDLFDTRPQVVLNYPTPGRMLLVSTRAEF